MGLLAKFWSLCTLTAAAASRSRSAVPLSVARGLSPRSHLGGPLCYRSLLCGADPPRRDVRLLLRFPIVCSHSVCFALEFGVATFRIVSVHVAVGPAISFSVAVAISVSIAFAVAIPVSIPSLAPPHASV